MAAPQHYWHVVQRRLPWLLVVSALAAAIAYVAAVRSGPTYEVHYSYLVSLSQRDTVASEFRFDGYYALQATDLFAATLATWAQTPEVVVAAYEAAGLPLPTTDARRLVRAITAEKTAPQLVQVTVRATTADVANRLASGLRTSMEKNVAAYRDHSIPAIEFLVTPTEPWQGVREVATAVIVAVTFVMTLLAGVNVVVLWESLRHIESGSSGRLT